MPLTNRAAVSFLFVALVPHSYANLGIDEAHAADAEARTRQLLGNVASAYEQLRKGGICARADLVEEEFLALSNTEAASEIQKQQDEVRRRFSGSDSLPERLAAVEHNVRFAKQNSVVIESHLFACAITDSWRLEHVITIRIDSVIFPDSLKHNRYAANSNLQGNKHRIYSWDGKAYSTTFNSDDALSRSVDIHTTPQKHLFLSTMLFPSDIPRDWMTDGSAIDFQIQMDTPDFVKIQIRDLTRSATHDITLLPRFGNAISNVRTETVNGFLIDRKCEDYLNLDGFSLALSITDSTYRVGAASGEPILIRRTRINIDKDSIEIGSISNLDFQPFVPDGATVHDYRFSPVLVYRSEEGLRLSESDTGAISQVISENKDTGSKVVEVQSLTALNGEIAPKLLVAVLCAGGLILLLHSQLARILGLSSNVSWVGGRGSLRILGFVLLLSSIALTIWTVRQNTKSYGRQPPPKADDVNLCAAKCVQYLLAYHKAPMTAEVIDAAFKGRIQNDTVSLLDLVEICESLGFNADALNVELNDLDVLPAPFIMHLAGSDELGHFVICSGATGNFVQMIDLTMKDWPVRTIRKQSLASQFTGYVLAVHRLGEIAKKDEEE